MTLRPAADADCERLWHWANDPVARTASFDSRSISWSDHVAWFRARRSDERSRIFVIEESDRPAGVVRFELDDRRGAVVSINIAPAARGRGLGQKALRRACSLISEQDSVSAVTAYIRPGNLASVRAFDQAGFVHAGATLVDGAEAVVMRWRSEEAAGDR